MRLSGIVATSHQFRQYTTELHNVLPQNVLLGTTYFLAIREIPRNKLTWAETSQDGFHWWYLKGHGETGQTCIHLGSPRWASEKCFRLYVRKDMNFSWNPLIYKLHTSTRSQLSSDVNRKWNYKLDNLYSPTITVSFICMTITTQHCESVNIKFKNTAFPLQAITVVIISTPASKVMCNLLAACSFCNALSLI